MKHLTNELVPMDTKGPIEAQEANCFIYVIQMTAQEKWLANGITEELMKRHCSSLIMD